MAAGVVLVSSLPYLIVSLTTPAGLRFGGALVNPIDGQSYLAKLRQGYDGAWLFRLPFTWNDEPDAFLFTYHLGLGHLARLTGLPLVAVYHLARAAGGWLLLVTIYAFLARAFDSTVERRQAWWFAALTSGLGWLGLPGADVTIPESNTFHSLLANAHFALAAALMLVVFTAVLDQSWRRAAPASIGLAILQPFAPVAMFAALGGLLVLKRIRRAPDATAVFSSVTGQGQWLAALIAMLSIAPLMLYFYFATQQDPILRGWSAQNVTPSPSPVEFVIGYGIVGLLAIPGTRSAWRRGRDVDMLLVAWAVTSVLLLYAPFPLQRRFSLGLHIPIVILGMMGLTSWMARGQAQDVRKWLLRVVFAASLPTTLFLLIATSSAAVRAPDPRLFFSGEEAEAFDWLLQNAAHDSVVMAAPDTGLFLPAWADVRVVYGHPFETLDAERSKPVVEDFFAAPANRDSIIRDYGVDYVFFGPRERELGLPDSRWQATFSAGDVTIYRVP